MTLPASGAITMNQVAVELGISATGISLNLASVRTLAGRASGAISMSDLRGKTNAPASALTIAGAYLSQQAGSVGLAVARFTLFADGTWTSTGTNNAPQSGRWQSGSDGANYEVYLTSAYGDLSGIMVINGWSSLDTSKYITVSDNTNNGLFDEATMIIRQKTNTSNTAQFMVYLEANGGCFAVGTLLRTPTGDRTVESFMVGDFASSFAEPSMIDENTEGWRDWSISSLDNVDTTTNAQVLGTRQFIANESVKLNGIHSTLSHVYFVFDGSNYVWKEAGDISSSDSFVDCDKNLVAITSIEAINEPTTFVALNVELLDTLQVKHDDTYLLTHNVSA